MQSCASKSPRPSFTQRGKQRLWWTGIGVVGGLIGALFLLAGTGCGRHGKAAPQGGSSLPPSKVNLKRNIELDIAKKQPLDYMVETVGYLEAEAQTDIAAGVTGKVDELNFREGQWVDRNTILVKVEQDRYQAAVEAAEAKLKRATRVLALARIKLDLGKRTTIAPEELEERQNAVDVGEADVKSAQADVRMARHNLDRSWVRAPYAGQINQRRITLDSYLEEKTVIATIADISSIRLVGYIPEKAMPTARKMIEDESRIQQVKFAGALTAARKPLDLLTAVAYHTSREATAGLPVEFSVQAFGNRRFQARVFYVSTVASPDTHMFECKALVQSAGLDVELKPGYTAQIYLPLKQSKADACIVSEVAVRPSEKGWIAFVPKFDGWEKDKDGNETPKFIAKARTLRLGYRPPNTGTVEVLDGIVPGEIIVRKGADALEDGTPIAIPKAQLDLIRELIPSNTVESK